MTTPTNTDTDATQTMTEAPRALADGDTIEVDFGDLGLDAPDSASPPAEPAKPDDPALRSESTPRETGRDRGRVSSTKALTKALRDERDDNKRLRDEREHYKRIAEQASRGRGHVEPGLRLAWNTPGLSAAERQQLIDEARRATDFGTPIEKVIDTFERRLAEFEQRSQQQITAQLDQQLRIREVAKMERDFIRDDHDDYRDVTRRAGIYDMTALDPTTGRPGPRFNREVAEAIGRADNPVEAAYWIAKELVGEADDHRPEVAPRRTSDPDDDPNPPPRPVSRRTDPTRSVPATPDDLAEAERRGAREVAARVADNGAKPRGVRALTPAGAPQQTRLDEDYRKYLDAQWDKNPQGVMALFARNPGLQDWYEGRTRG